MAFTSPTFVTSRWTAARPPKLLAVNKEGKSLLHLPCRAKRHRCSSPLPFGVGHGRGTDEWAAPGPLCRGLGLPLRLGIQGSAERLRKTGNAESAAALDFAECTTVVATGLSFAPVKFYEMLEEPGARVVSFPIDISFHPENMDPGQYTNEGLAEAFLPTGAGAPFSGRDGKAYRPPPTTRGSRASLSRLFRASIPVPKKVRAWRLASSSRPTRMSWTAIC